MQDTKEYILKKAFEVFLTKGYDSTSMTVLQQEFKMSRGAMYRYFSSKDDLFRAVIDRYFFGILEFMRPRVTETMTIPERIDVHYDALQKICKRLDGVEGLEGIFLNYTAMIIQAGKHCPGFLESWKSRQINELKSWEKTIQNSIQKGEVRKDINVRLMAQIFLKSIDINDDTENMGKSFTSAAKLTRKKMIYIYSLIQI